MNTRIIVLIAFAMFGVLSCKKEPTPVKEEPKIEIPDLEDSPTLAYKLINRKLKASDVNGMNLDVNEDGVIDYAFFMHYVVMSGKINLYAGVNPVYGSATSADDPNDNEYLNMGLLHTFENKALIKQNLAWKEDHVVLSVRHEAMDGSKTYSGSWGNGQERIMSIRLLIKGKMHYGWAKLKFDKVTEELILIDAAWNTIAEEEIKAGAK